MGLYGVMGCVRIDTLWNLEVIYERPFFFYQENTPRALCDRAAPTEFQISAIFAAGLVLPHL